MPALRAYSSSFGGAAWAGGTRALPKGRPQELGGDFEVILLVTLENARFAGIF